MYRSKKQVHNYRRNLSKTRRQAVYERDGFRCVYCQKGQEELEANGAFLTIDHRKPISKGGTNEFPNLQTLCNICNNLKAKLEDPRALRYAERYARRARSR